MIQHPADDIHPCNIASTLADEGHADAVMPGHVIDHELGLRPTIQAYSLRFNLCPAAAPHILIARRSYKPKLFFNSTYRGADSRSTAVAHGTGRRRALLNALTWGPTVGLVDVSHEGGKSIDIADGQGLSQRRLASPDDRPTHPASNPRRYGPIGPGSYHDVRCAISRSTGELRCPRRHDIVREQCVRPRFRRFVGQGFLNPDPDVPAEESGLVFASWHPTYTEALVAVLARSFASVRVLPLFCRGCNPVILCLGYFESEGLHVACCRGNGHHRVRLR